MARMYLGINCRPFTINQFTYVDHTNVFSYNWGGFSPANNTFGYFGSDVGMPLTYGVALSTSGSSWTELGNFITPLPAGWVGPASNGVDYGTVAKFFTGDAYYKLMSNNNVTYCFKSTNGIFFTDTGGSLPYGRPFRNGSTASNTRAVVAQNDFPGTSYDEIATSTNFSTWTSIPTSAIPLRPGAVMSNIPKTITRGSNYFYLSVPLFIIGIGFTTCDAWSADGTTWTILTPPPEQSGAAPGDYSFDVFLDGGNGITFSWAGAISTTSLYRSTDGLSFAPITVPGAHPNSTYEIAYTGSRHVLIASPVFGGSSTLHVSINNGITWTQVMDWPYTSYDNAGPIVTDGNNRTVFNLSSAPASPSTFVLFED